MADPLNGQRMQAPIWLFARGGPGEEWQQICDFPEWLPDLTYRFNSVACGQYRVTACGPAAPYPRVTPAEYCGTLSDEQPSATCNFAAVRATQPFSAEILLPEAGTVGNRQVIQLRVTYQAMVNLPVYCRVRIERAPPYLPLVADLLELADRPLNWEPVRWASLPETQECLAICEPLVDWDTTCFYNDPYVVTAEVHFDDYWSETDQVAGPVSRSYSVRNLVIR
ncbi:MAG: hypothetical protein IT204_15360 [Fimbriimonadaceae bacterium]|nr:hypothetical protein [Fimbriimonadaceae bacterium]